MADQFQPREEEIDAGDYREFFESEILRVWHLRGKQRVFRIVRVTKLTSEMFANGKRKVTTQPKLELATRDGVIVPLPFLLNKTNAKTIAQLYSRRPSEWVGKWIHLYPTVTERAGEQVDCIRVRNQVPGANRPGVTNKQGANVLPPPAPRVDDIPPPEQGETHDRDDGVLDADFEEVIQ